MKTPALALPGTLAAVLLAVPAFQSVTLRGEEARTLTASAPRTMTIRRGASAPLEIGIDRGGFFGPVILSLFQLPRGIEADRSSFLAGRTNGTFLLKASPSAALASHHSVGVTVEGPDGYQATQFVNLTVQE